MKYYSGRRNFLRTAAAGGAGGRDNGLVRRTREALRG